MKNTFRTTVCCIACTLIAASTWAQREPGSTPGSQQTPGSSSQRSSQGGLGSQSQRSTSYSSSIHGQQQSLRVSQQIMNAQVKTQDGQQLGQIEDLIANPQTGKIEFAVISKGDKLCAIPMQLLQPQQGAQGSSSTSTSGTTSGTSTTETTPGTPGSTTSSTSPSYGRSGALGQKVTFVAQVDRSKLEQAPSFSRTQWPEISSTWSQQIYSHFGVQPEAAGGTSSSSSTSQGKSSSSSSTTSDPSKSTSDSDTEKRSKDKEN